MCSRHVSTDHCPFNWPEQKGINGREFQVVPNGGPGIENRLHMLWTHGVRDRVGSRRTASSSSSPPTSRSCSASTRARARSRPARTPTSSSGIPEKKLTISAETHHTNVNYNLFEGEKVTGAPEVVLVRGQVIVENDELVAQPGAGQFVKRARFGEELQPAQKARA